MRARGPDRVGGAERVLLDSCLQLIVEGFDERALRVVDHHDLAGAGATRRLNGPADQRPPTQRMQQLGRLRTHARSLAGGDDHDDRCAHAAMVSGGGLWVGAAENSRSSSIG